MHRLEVTLPGVASSVPPARHFVERTLEAWELAALSWAAALIVTELTANAALHAGTEFTVAVSLDEDVLRLEVSDGSAASPRLRRHSESSTTGRGLRLVDELSRAWGVRADDGGKVVWVELPVAAEAGGDSEDLDADALLAAFADPLDADEPGVAGHACALLPLAA